MNDLDGLWPSFICGAFTLRLDYVKEFLPEFSEENIYANFIRIIHVMDSNAKK